MFNKDRQSAGLIGIAVVAALGSLVWAWLPLVASVLLLGSVALLRLGIFARLGIAVFVYGILGSMAIELTTLLRVGMNFTALSLVLLAAAFLYAYRNRRRIDLKSSMTDLVGLAVAGTVFIVLATPYIGSSSSKILAALLPGEDNSSHLQMYRYVVEDKQYAFHNDIDNAGIRPSLRSYAQGSHGAMAAVTAPFIENASEDNQLRAYVYGAVATFTMMFWFGFLVIVRPLSALKNWRAEAALAGVAAGGFILFAALGIFLSLYTYGYYPQFFAYAALALLLLAAVSVAEAKGKSQEFNMAELGVMVIAVFGIFTGWYMLTPVAIPIVAAYAWANRKALLANKRNLALISIPLSILVAYLLYIYVFMSNGSGHLLTPGGVDKMQTRVLAVCVPATLIALAALRKKQWYHAGIAAVVPAAGSITVYIALYQLKEIKHLDYYFYKSLFTVLFVAMLYYGYSFTSWLATVLATTRLSAFKNIRIIWPAIGLLVTAFVVIPNNLPKYASTYTQTKNTIPESAPGRLLDVLTNPVIYQEYSDVLVLSSCNPYTNFTGSIWASSYFLPYNEARWKIEASLLSRHEELATLNSPLLAEITEYATGKDKPVAIMLGEIYCKPLHADTVVKQLSSAPNIRFIDTYGNPIIRP